MYDDIVLVPRSAFFGLLRDIGSGEGLTVRDRDGLGLATVISRKGQRHALAEKVLSAFALELPTGPRRVSAVNLAFAGTAPGTWLASHELDAGYAGELRARLAGLASVSDQSGGMAILRLSGPKVRDVLAKGAPIDLHASAFRIGDVAATVCSHLSVTIWRLEDEADLSPAYELAIFRSLAGSLWSWLAEAAAEFGIAVKGCHGSEVRRG